MRSLQTQLDDACRSIQHEIGLGKVADYIPALAQVPPDKFAAAIVTVDGEKAVFGDARETFSIQSISKLFTLTSALNLHDRKIWERVGREPSGNAFNSIVQLEMECGIPRNPFINAGALVVTDALLGDQTTETCTADLLSLVQSLAADSSIEIDQSVAQSERDTAYRNISLAHFMQSFGNLQRLSLIHI